MKFSLMIPATIFLLAMIPAESQAAEEAAALPPRLITAVDLLKQKNLSPFQPACAVGGPASGLITAEDLLRHKGLVGKMAPTTGVKSDQEEDIWGMQQDFGC